jgi:hypothetical protein
MYASLWTGSIRVRTISRDATRYPAQRPARQGRYYSNNLTTAVACMNRNDIRYQFMYVMYQVKQERRTLIYMDFTRRNAACMLATDIAARYAPPPFSGHVLSFSLIIDWILILAFWRMIVWDFFLFLQRVGFSGRGLGDSSGRSRGQCHVYSSCG